MASVLLQVRRLALHHLATSLSLLDPRRLRLPHSPSTADHGAKLVLELRRGGSGRLRVVLRLASVDRDVQIVTLHVRSVRPRLLRHQQLDSCL